MNNFDDFINESDIWNTHEALWFMTTGEIDLGGYLQIIDPTGYSFRIWLYDNTKNGTEMQPRNQYVDIRIEPNAEDDIYELLDYYTGKRLLYKYQMKKNEVVNLRSDLDPLKNGKNLLNVPTIKELVTE